MNKTSVWTDSNGRHHEGCICEQCLADMTAYDVVEVLEDEYDVVELQGDPFVPTVELIADEPAVVRMLRLGMTDGTFGQ